MKKNNQDAINDFRNCLVAVDLSPFYGTLWGLVNAASDFAYHRTPTRMTSTYQEGKMNQAIYGCGLLDKVMVAVYHFLYGNALFTGTDGHGYTVLIATADKHHVLLLESEVTYIDVGGNVHAGEVTDVHGAVGVGERRGDEGAFIFFCHVCCLFCYLLIII